MILRCGIFSKTHFCFRPRSFTGKLSKIVSFPQMVLMTHYKKDSSKSYPNMRTCPLPDHTKRGTCTSLIALFDTHFAGELLKKSLQCATHSTGVWSHLKGVDIENWDPIVVYMCSPSNYRSNPYKVKPKLQRGSSLIPH